MTTLSDGVTTVDFSSDLFWVDEYSWQPVELSQERTLTGGLVIQGYQRTAGRPITLASDDPRAGWVRRAALDQLWAWAADHDQELTLTYRGLARQVMWRHADGPISATPVADYSDPGPDDYYRATFRFMEV